MTRPVWLVTVAVLLCGAAARAQIVPSARAGQPRTGELDIACGPRAVYGLPYMGLTILGSQQGTMGLIAPYHGLVVNGGSNQGLKVGQEYYVRRVIPPMDRGNSRWQEIQAIGIHTAGWIRIVRVEGSRAVADSVYACDGYEIGDYLEPYTPPSADPKAIPGGEPDYENPGVVLFGDDRRAMGAGTLLMVIDRGGDHGVKPGQQLTVYRRSLNGTGPIHSVARGTAIAVMPESSMVRLDGARAEVYSGDLVALHR
ncbi:MAG: hypothetical protein ACRD09_06355 [Vicinamibacterales bacterium]